jgi:hypothetical protein
MIQRWWRRSPMTMAYGRAARGGGRGRAGKSGAIEAEYFGNLQNFLNMAGFGQ